MALSRPGAVSKRLALAVLLASILVLASALPAAAAPAATSSYYVRATDSASDAVWFDYGCAQGRADEQRPGAEPDRDPRLRRAHAGERGLRL
jgi:hypothetical protein